VAGAAATDNVSVCVWVIELELNGFPDIPVAVSVTGALVTGALDAALSTNVCGDPIPTVAVPGATPTFGGSPLNTRLMLPVEPCTAAT
jgi:hypothetical protein